MSRPLGLPSHPQHGIARRLFRDGLFRIAPGQVRLSVGVADPGALLADLRQALDAT